MESVRPDAGTESVAEGTRPPALEEPAPVVPATRTIRQLRVPIEAATTGRPVELLLQQRPDGVEVSVHSPDSQLRDSLRSGLANLVSTLDRQGVVTELLAPQPVQPAEVSREWTVRVPSGDDSGATVSEMSEPENFSDSQRQQKQPQWESNGDQRRKRDQQPDAWQKYLEEYTWRNR